MGGLGNNDRRQQHRRLREIIVHPVIDKIPGGLLAIAEQNADTHRGRIPEKIAVIQIRQAYGVGTVRPHPVGVDIEPHTVANSKGKRSNTATVSITVNDFNMAQKMGFDVNWMNNYGSSIIFGHPQGPTGGRLIAELIEEVVMLGGGYGLWAGCAAGDTAAAVAFKIG